MGGHRLKHFLPGRMAGATAFAALAWLPGPAPSQTCQWSALGSGAPGPVSALAVFDDGTGPALYAGVTFGDNVAKWNGTTWSPLTPGPNSSVTALAVFDDGTGPALSAGGRFEFTAAGGTQANFIAKWDGTQWSALGSGMGGVSPPVSALTVFDNGTGAALYARGASSPAPGAWRPTLSPSGAVGHRHRTWRQLDSTQERWLGESGENMRFKQTRSFKEKMLFCGLLLRIAILGVPGLQAQIITTVAGNGVAGYNGVGVRPLPPA